jgi:hypothetical protein
MFIVCNEGVPRTGSPVCTLNALTRSNKLILNAQFSLLNDGF